MDYKLDNKTYVVNIIKKNNKSTYIRVKEDLSIQVTTNAFTTKKTIKKLLDDNNEFLRESINKINNKKEKENKFMILGKEYEVIFMPVFKHIKIAGNVIYASDQKKLDKWLKEETKRIFTERLKYNFDRFEENIPFPGLKIRSMKTRWGVCNRKGMYITLNSMLIRESLDKLDYVIVHELSHLVHFDHSRAFWAVVGKYCPKYKKIRSEMRE